ncbi:hypothetical protein [Amycolatopsis sp.]|jgi:hypothetical protein|uniref:hypothetical protein n=1 Tax=Amycolatopsis sp. TaxID=37632 RepID=UPI002DFF6A79|nr:hypothetical protein [Amycolatopsis sp.]
MAERQRAPWPEKNADKVWEHASKRDHQGAMDTWYVVRDQLFGSADAMEGFATWWGQSTFMTNTEDVIDLSRENLVAYWQGGGYDSYAAYAMNATKRISRNETVMNEIAGTFEGCIDIVYDTYANAIEFMSACAHDLIEAEATTVEEIVLPWTIITNVIQLLNNFVKNINDLIAKSVRQMGELREKGVFLARQANDFADVKEMAGAVGNPDLWQVKPIKTEA